MRTIYTAFYICIVAAVFLAGPAKTALAQQRDLSLIRDTEIENYIKSWASPVIAAAQVPGGTVNIVIVRSDQINAFVAGGANIFLFTGLIEETDGPGELIGVIAHEMGHIAGGHLISGREAIERASYESILGTILGIGTAIATGNGQAAAAITSGATNLAARRYLSHSRLHESSADQAALSYMEKAEMNPEGLVSFLGKLSDQELVPASQQTEYVRTHPLTPNRIEAVKTRAEESEFYGRSFPESWEEQHARMKAKLVAFINPGRVPWEYSDSDKSIPARYARTIAAYRESREDQAIAGINALLDLEPENPYFHELKGQMLFDFGRIEEAIPPYRKAVSILPDAPLLHIALAHALIEARGGQDKLEEAIRHLETALVKEPRSARAYRLAGTAYGQMGKTALAQLYLAEEAVLQKRYDYARQLAEKAKRELPEGSPERLKAIDLLTFLENRPE